MSDNELRDLALAYRFWGKPTREDYTGERIWMTDAQADYVRGYLRDSGLPSTPENIAVAARKFINEHPMKAG